MSDPLPRFAIATRNNPVALAALLGSMIRYTLRGTKRIDLSICDASDSPVITHPQIARMFTMFKVHYQHTLRPNVNEQRISALSIYPKDAMVIIMDDDLVVDSESNHIAAFTELKEWKTVFGVTVDIINDRGYPDFSRQSKDRFYSIHSFPSYAGSTTAPVLMDDSIVLGAANPGHLMCIAGEYIEAVDKAMRLDPDAPPEVIDDAAALYLAMNAPNAHVSRLMMCEHIGNSNGNWKGGPLHKRIAVSALTERMLACTESSTEPKPKVSGRAPKPCSSRR